MKKNIRYLCAIAVVVPALWSCTQIPGDLGRLNYNPVKRTMVPVKGGTFQMGQTGVTNATPVHQVTVSSFLIDNTDVPQADYQAVMGINPSYYADDSLAPVVSESWNDAVLYCNARSRLNGLDTVYSFTSIWFRQGNAPGSGCDSLGGLVIDYSKKGFRLPTEAEWEYACRAGSTTRCYWGDAINLDYCWDSTNSGHRPHRVGQKVPNDFGLYDMNGNVLQWCNDWYAVYPSVSQIDPIGPLTGTLRVLRGGSWASRDIFVNSACRWKDSSGNRFSDAGFRCVLEASVISPVLGLPANGATGQALSLMLSWQPVTNATGYNVQVSTSSSFATLFIQDSTLTSASKTIGGLSGGVTYYWRVRAETAGEKSAWSTVWSFTTSAVTLQAPMLLSPSNASTNQPVTCLLSWSAVTNATGYHVQVSTNSAFTVIFSQDSTLTADSMKLGGLASGTTYYWRVRARNAGGAGYWSGTWSFITTSSALGTPTLFAPLNGATAQVLPLALTWSTVTNATSYRVQVSSDSTFSTVKVDDSTLVSASKTVDSLTRGVKFFWRVRAKNATVVSSWTTPWNFTTAQSSIPAVPTLVSPSNGAPGQPQILTLIWSPVGGDSTYRVQLSTSSTFATLAVDDSTLTAANRAVGTLAPGTTYYWRVRAKNAFGSSAWTGVWSFTTSTAPLPSPVLNSPANGAAGLNPVALQLSWSAVTNATSYRIQVSSDSAFSSVAVDDSALASPLKTLDSLPRGVKFYWRVRAKNAAGVSVWASPWNFTTVAPPIPSVPTLVSPVNSSVNQSRRPTLVWSTVSGAATYHVQVSLDSSFSIVLIKDSTLTTASKTIDSLPYGVKVFWRVRAKNAIGTSGWSSAWSFTTIAAAASPWVTKTPMPTAKIYMGIAVLNNKIYLIGGYNGTSYIATVEMYDPSIDKWSTMPDMPMSRAPAAAVYNNKIYVIGGGDIGTVQEYDPGANTWIDKTPMPTVRGPAVTMIGSIIYAIGGYNSITGSLGTNESYDPSTDTWSSLADMTARNSTPVAAAGGKVYAFGGEYWPSTPLNLVEEYDPLGNAWATKTVLPTARTRAAAVTVNRKIYVIGGTDDVIDLAKVDLYDPSSDTWTAKTAMPTARSGSGIAFVNGKIYVFGGSSSSNPHLTTVEEYDPLLDP